MATHGQSTPPRARYGAHVDRQQPPHGRSPGTCPMRRSLQPRASRAKALRRLHDAKFQLLRAARMSHLPQPSPPRLTQSVIQSTYAWSPGGHLKAYTSAYFQMPADACCTLYMWWPSAAVSRSLRESLSHALSHYISEVSEGFRIDVRNISGLVLCSTPALIPYSILSASLR